MASKFRIIPHQTMEHDAKVDRRMVNRPTDVTLDDSALKVMTDLNEITPFCIDPSTCIDAANEKMIACGVRLLFVTDANDDLLGLVTSSDILGEKPVRLITKRGGNRIDIATQDVMTPKSEIKVIDIHDVENATVGDIIETMKTIGRQHTLVVETTDDRQEVIRGIFSTSQIEKQTGTKIQLSHRVTTFAELEKAVMSV